MRVAVANACICMNRGGSERAAIRLAEKMLERGHDAHLLTVRRKTPVQYDISPALPAHFVPEKIYDLDPDALREGTEFLRTRKIEVLTGLESGKWHEIWRRIASDAGIPYVCSERNAAELMERLYWTRQGRQAFLDSCAAIHELLPCHIASLSDENRRKAFVIPNGAPEDIPREYPERDPGQTRILFLGRFEEQKRPQLLMEAFALLADDFPQWSLLFAGWGKKEPELKAAAEKCGLKARAEIRSAARDVSQDYLASSIYCLPSLYEGFPNTALEAMGYGLPIVGMADCIVMKSIIAPDRTGLIAPEPTPRALADALRKLMLSPETRKRMGKAAWRECREKYGDKIWESWEEELLKVIIRSRHYF